jgi:hypothetical protein
MHILWILAWTLHADPSALETLCLQQMKAMPGNFSEAEIKTACAKTHQLEGCTSNEGVPIYHYERAGSSKTPKHILAKALIHGDERIAGTVARAWMARLEKIEPRNTWRVIPVVNPDGWKARTRTNGHGVDLNRNFPTKNWDEQAVAYWKKQMKSDPRRNPGPSAASEVETQCLIKEFDDFKPDFIISVHTPLGVLDLDGPKVPAPSFRPLPWTSLGNFPGSLGRYMWADRKVPVLTIELKGNEDIQKLEAFDRLQDISGTIAIQAGEVKARPAGKRADAGS